jgi:hypothetical protein
MPQDLDLYLLVDSKKFKSINAKFQVKVGYLVYFNHLQDYKIHETMIKMFCPSFWNNLWQLQPMANKLNKLKL